MVERIADIELQLQTTPHKKKDIANNSVETLYPTKNKLAMNGEILHVIN